MRRFIAFLLLLPTLAFAQVTGAPPTSTNLVSAFSQITWADGTIQTSAPTAGVGITNETDPVWVEFLTNSFTNVVGEIASNSSPAETDPVWLSFLTNSFTNTVGEIASNSSPAETDPVWISFLTNSFTNTVGEIVSNSSPAETDPVHISFITNSFTNQVNSLAGQAATSALATSVAALETQVSDDLLTTNDINSESTLESAVGGTNILVQEEIDTFVELNTIVTDVDLDHRTPYILDTGSTATNAIRPVLGGNTASGAFSTVAGGVINSALGDHSAVSGGSNNLARGEFDAIVGGFTNKTRAINRSQFVGGGENNEAFGDWSAIVGGRRNVSGTEGGFVGGGEDNDSLSRGGAIVGGDDNEILNIGAQHSFIGSGLDNAVYGEKSFAVAGNAAVVGAVVSDATDRSGTIGGLRLTISKSDDTVLVGGQDNSAVGASTVSFDEVKRAVIFGGSFNQVRQDSTAPLTFVNVGNIVAGGEGNLVQGHAKASATIASRGGEVRHSSDSLVAAAQMSVIVTSFHSFVSSGIGNYTRSDGSVSLGSGIINTGDFNLVWNPKVEIHPAITNMSPSTNVLYFPGQSFGNLTNQVIIRQFMSGTREKEIGVITNNGSTNIAALWLVSSNAVSDRSNVVYTVFRAAHNGADGEALFNGDVRVAGTNRVTVHEFPLGDQITSDGTNLFYQNLTGQVANITGLL